MTTIAIANQKGGVGKTTIALNLAQGLAARGYHTLAVDNDAQGNLTSGLLDDPTALAANVLSFYDDARQAVHPQRIQKHLELIGADIRLAKIADRDFEVIFRLREGLDELRHAYDFILIDCVPSFGYWRTCSGTPMETSSLRPSSTKEYGWKKVLRSSSPSWSTSHTGGLPWSFAR